MSRTCFSSVIFKKNLPFFDTFLKALNDQTDDDFVLLLFNDGIENLEDLIKETNLTIEIIPVSGFISDIRTLMLEYIRNSYFEMVIFGDTDDYFPPNRIALNKQLLQDYDVIGNDISLVTEEGKIIKRLLWKDRLELKKTIDHHSILEYNFLGLGNTAIRSEVLPKDLHFDRDIIAVDWILFSRILKKHPKVKFTSDTFIYYRQHNNSMVGRKKLSLELFKKVFEVKKTHFITMALEDSNYGTLASEYTKFEETLPILTETTVFKHCKELKNPFWFEEIEI